MPLYIRSLDDIEKLFDITKDFGRDKPFRRILQIVFSQGCKSVIIEDDYDDPDYRSEYEGHYRALFKNYLGVTERLHFFSCKVKQPDLIDLTQLQDYYLGFCVLRPIGRQRVVNAVVNYTEDKRSTSKRRFLLCREQFEINIGSSKLTIQGFPFKQQDSEFGCCAHAVLGMLSKYMAKRFKIQDAGFSDIVASTSTAPDERRPIPTTGLTPLQMSYAIKRLGLSPLIYTYGERMRPRFPPERVLYHYCESRIPVILGIQTAESAHALVAVGHAFEPDTWWALEQSPYYNQKPSGGIYHCSTTWIPSFLVHDDNFGPYLSIPKEFLWASADSSLTIMIALPPNIHIPGEEAELYALKIFDTEIVQKSVENKIDKTAKKWIDLFLRHYREEDLVLRTFLKPSAEYVDTLREDINNEDLLSFYVNRPYPEYVWVTEVSIPELFCQHRMKLGEIIIDPTANLNFGHAFLSIHLPGVIVVRNVNDETIEGYSIASDAPREHLIR